MQTQELDYPELREQGTQIETHDDAYTIAYPFDRYVVKVRLGPSNEFLGITEITLNRDFLSERQRLSRLASIPASDADSFYLQTEED